MPLIITPSILSADLSQLQKEIESIEPYADWLQIDVMDGHFVPNLSFGAPVMKWLKTKLPLDVHLMVTNPQDRINEFVETGATNITFHAEAVPDPEEQRKLIDRIHKAGCTVGIALNPETPLSILGNAMPGNAARDGRSDDLQTFKPSNLPFDLLLLMTVQPGFGGQRFIESVLPKIKEAHQKFPSLMIQVDGGINAETGKRCREAGATNIVAGSFIFKAKDRKKAIEALRNS